MDKGPNASETQSMNAEEYMTNPYRITTPHGHPLGEAVSAVQKAIRRGDARMAGYFAIQVYMSGCREYLWRRLLVISAEDCHGLITHEVEALYRAWKIVMASAPKKSDPKAGRVFASKATLLLALCAKSRDADHLTNLVHDRRWIDEQAAAEYLRECEADRMAVPDCALDCHTSRGRKMGRSRDTFIVDEFDALQPRQPGLFDQDVERHRREVGRKR